jgi:hypothetical protein
MGWLPPYARSSACTGTSCTEQAAPQPPPPSAGGGAASNAGTHPQPPAGSQDNSNGKLLLPQLDSLHLAFKQRQGLTKHWAPFKVLRQWYASRSSASFTCHRNTSPLSQTPPCAWR